ncbi:MAG: cell division protein ZapA [Flavobacteriales bacterium]|nr:cell division protein ZapA [Flavobacteriales bacterium]
MSEFSIKINVAGRVYPLTIEEHEEVSIRKAQERIAKDLKALENNYAIRDKQDLLAMLLLQYASEIERNEVKREENTQAIEKLSKVESLLKDYLEPVL